MACCAIIMSMGSSIMGLYVAMGVGDMACMAIAGLPGAGCILIICSACWGVIAFCIRPKAPSPTDPADANEPSPASSAAVKPNNTDSAAISPH